MDIVKGLQSTFCWTRAVALSGLKKQDIYNPEIFTVVLDLLDDTTIIEIPPGRKNSGEQDLMAFLKQSPVQRMQGKNDPVETLSLLCNLAEQALQRELPATDRSLDLLITHALNSKFKTRLWIDRNFWNFRWPLPAAAFKKYLKAVAVMPQTYLLNVIKKADLQSIHWAIDFALSRNPPIIRILEIILPDQAGSILECIVAKSVKDASLLPLLTQIAEFDDQALNVMKYLEESGLIEACGYLALFDVNAARRFRMLLINSFYPEKQQTQYLVEKVCKMKPYPLFFPLEELAGVCDRDFVIKHLNSNLPAQVRQNILLNLVNTASFREEMYYPLCRLAELGTLKEQAALAALFWDVLREKLTSFLPPSDFDHPLIRLADPALQPPDFRKKLLGFVADNLISLSFALSCLSDTKFSPQEAGIVRTAIRRELTQVEEDWEHEKQERIKYPGRYLYLDRESCSSILTFLKQRWDDFLLVARCLGMDAEVVRIERLMQIDWKKELSDLFASGDQA